MRLALSLSLAALVACAGSPAPVRLTLDWPAQAGDYGRVTSAWTRSAALHGVYQEALEVSAVFKSPEWRAAHAERDARHRGLSDEARQRHLQQARAAMEGPWELELLVTTWDRRENDLDRGKRSVWRVVLIDDAGNEIEPLEIVEDKRPVFMVRADFPTFGDFATAYVARFPRTTPILGPAAQRIRLRVSSSRGGVELVWAGTAAPGA